MLAMIIKKNNWVDNLQNMTQSTNVHGCFVGRTGKPGTSTERTQILTSEMVQMYMPLPHTRHDYLCLEFFDDVFQSKTGSRGG